MDKRKGLNARAKEGWATTADREGTGKAMKKIKAKVNCCGVWYKVDGYALPNNYGLDLGVHKQIVRMDVNGPVTPCKSWICTEQQSGLTIGNKPFDGTITAALAHWSNIVDEYADRIVRSRDAEVKQEKEQAKP